MKSRIMETLHSIALGNGKAEKYEKDLLKAFPEWDLEKLQSQSKVVYKKILHDYSKFSVSTIDKFVQRIIRSFAWELGLDSAYRLQLDMDPVKIALAEGMYQRLDTNKDLLQWAETMAENRLDEGKNWDFRQEIMELSSELFNEKFAPFEKWMNDNHSEQEVKFRSLQNLLNKTTAEIRTKWTDFANEVTERVADAGLSVNDFSGKTRGFFNTFLKISRGEIAMPGKTFCSVASGDAALYPKTAAASVKADIDAIAPELLDACNTFIHWAEEDIPLYTTAESIARYFGTLRLMAVFVEELGNYRKENSVLLISDTHHLLNVLTRDVTASFMFEKMGSQYRHYLIDEFQDTSRFQWENFIPLFEESLGNANANLVVGDVKQAIYRWRNGDWRLLLREVQHDLNAFEPVNRTLETNYRSSRPVIHFNNLFFYRAARVMQNNLNLLMEEAPAHVQLEMRALNYDQIFTQAYADSGQQVPDNARENGGVCLQWVNFDESKEGEEPTDDELLYGDRETKILDSVFETVIALLTEGYAPGDIGILTRTNAEARAIIRFFSAQLNDPEIRETLEIPPFKIMSGDALLLSSNPVIRLVIAAIRFFHARQPDKIALSEMRHIYAALNGREANNHALFAGQQEVLPPLFFQKEVLYRMMPVQELVHELVIDLELHTIPGNDDFLKQLYDLIANWAQQGEGGLGNFLLYWNEEGNKLTLPASPSPDAMEVITIHKSKGLAYPIVLLPFIGWDNKGKGDILWVDTSETPFKEIPVLPVKMGSGLAGSLFAKEYFEELVLSGMDSLNVLYVAATRARERWYGWLPKDTRKSSTNMNKINFVIDMIACAACDGEPEYGANIQQGFAPDESWKHGELVRKEDPWEQKEAMPHAELSLNPFDQRIKLRYEPLELEDEEEREILPRELGVLYHAILAKMQRPADLGKSIQYWIEKGLLQEKQAHKAQEVLQKMLMIDCLQAWQSDAYKTLAERTLVNTDRELRRPDLILYNNAETRVFDFKFTSSAKLKIKYADQLKEYLQLLQQAGFPKPKGWIVYALENKVTEVDL